MKGVVKSEAAASTSSEGSASAPVSPFVPVPAFDQGMLELLSNPESAAKEAVILLLKVITNIVDHPMEEKYRKLKSSNAAFSKKIGSLRGGSACMIAVGFLLVGEEWVLQPSAEAWDVLLACQAKLDRFMSRCLEGPPPALQSAEATPPPPPQNAESGKSDDGPPEAVDDESALHAMQQLLLSVALLQSGENTSPDSAEGAAAALASSDENEK